MDISVISEIGIVHKTFATNVTFVFLLIVGSVLRLNMPFHFCYAKEFSTFRTWYFLMHSSDVLSKVFGTVHFKITLLTFECFVAMNGSQVNFQM